MDDIKERIKFAWKVLRRGKVSHPKFNPVFKRTIINQKYGLRILRQERVWDDRIPRDVQEARLKQELLGSIDDYIHIEEYEPENFEPKRLRAEIELAIRV